MVCHGNYTYIYIYIFVSVTLQQDVQGYKKNDMNDVYFSQKSTDKKKKNSKSDGKENCSVDINVGSSVFYYLLIIGVKWLLIFFNLCCLTDIV